MTADTADFAWRDAGRTVVFRGGALGSAVTLLSEHGFDSFELLSTERALAGAPGLAEGAGAVHKVAPGGVPDAAAAILDQAGGAGHLVALGGGRVIDTAKAIAAVSAAAVAAIPTTMSGAEMTGIHRLPAGAEDRAAGLVRPALVIADPEAMTAQPEPQLRASSMNALGHGADSLYTPYANPVSRMSALRGAGMIAASLDQDREGRDRRALALGSILCGYAIDSALFALHHVICQTLVRVCGSSHAETNAAILPRAMAAMRGRAPERDRRPGRGDRHRSRRNRAADPRPRRQPGRPRGCRSGPLEPGGGPGRDRGPSRAWFHARPTRSRGAARDHRGGLVAPPAPKPPRRCRDCNKTPHWWLRSLSPARRGGRGSVRADSRAAAGGL